MKTKIIFSVIILTSLLQSVELYSQKLKELRDFSKRDSIPLYNVVNEDKLKIDNTLNVSNEFSGNYNLGNWYDYRNLTMVEYGVKIKDLPLLFNVGNERGKIYNNEFQHWIFNVKIDFQKYLENKLEKTDIRKSIERFDNPLSESIFQDEIKKKLRAELNNRLPTNKLDTLYNKIESMRQFEKKLQNPLDMEKIKEQRIILKEYNLGNKIDGLNYDSLLAVQNKFDKDYEDYKLNQKDKEVQECRAKYEEVLRSKEKISEIRDKTESRLTQIKEKWNPIKSLDFKKLQISKFNLGQTSIDNSELVFRSFMVNGLNLELKSPFYLHFVYSLPFQTNIFTNYSLNSIQNNQVSTLGGAVGLNPEKRFNTQIGYYRFNEKNGSYNLGNNRSLNMNNEVLILKSALKWNQKIKTTLEIAKSETSKYPYQNLWNTNDIQTSTALILKNELDLWNGNTQVKLDIQRVGLGYYSSANPFVQRGTGGLMSLNQKLGSKFSLKTKLSYRYSADSNRDNSNLSTYGALRYKLNRNTSFEARGSYFQNQIEYKTLYSYMNAQIYSLMWMQRLRIKRSIHFFTTSAQYSRTESRSSTELNNSGLTRVVQVLSNYSTTINKLAINANLEDNYTIDSSLHNIGSGVNANYAISEKTNIGLGLQSRYSRSSFIQTGANLSFSTSIDRFILSGNLQYSYDKLLNYNILSPQLRMNYKIF